MVKPVGNDQQIVGFSTSMAMFAGGFLNQLMISSKSAIHPIQSPIFLLIITIFLGFLWFSFGFPRVSYGFPHLPTVFVKDADSRKAAAAPSAALSLREQEISSGEPQNSDVLRMFFGFNWLIYWLIYGYRSIPINTIFRGMNIHLPATVF